MKYIAILVAVLMSLGSCGIKKKKQAQNSQIEIPSAPPLYKNWTYFSAKSSVEFNGLGQNVSGMISWRMKKDSIIWFSATAVLGIQVAKGVITKDSIWLLNVINKEYHAMAIKDAKKLLGAEVQLSPLQNALIGAAMFNPPAVYTCDSGVCTSTYKEFSNTLIYNKLNILEKSSLYKTGSTSNLNFTYSNKIESPSYWVPETVDIKGQSAQNNVHAILVFKSINDNIIPSFPFDIPSGYTKL